MISDKTINICKDLVNKEIANINEMIAHRTGYDPDVVDTAWFDDKQKRRERLVATKEELNEEARTRHETRRKEAAHGNSHT